MALDGAITQIRIHSRRVEATCFAKESTFQFCYFLFFLNERSAPLSTVMLRGQDAALLGLPVFVNDRRIHP